MDMQELLDYYLHLSQNNCKSWFDAHRKDYEASQEKLARLAERMIEGCGQFDPRCQGLQPKDCLYRIYRDIRFSKDKRPYKDWHGIYVCPKGKKSGMAGYYLHLEPINDLYFLCAGLYNPSKEVLQSVREQIMLEPDEFHEALQACGTEFRLSWDNALKRMPLGYRETDKHSEYYRLRSYEVCRTLSREEVLEGDFLNRAIELLGRCHTYNELLNQCYDYAYDPDK